MTITRSVAIVSIASLLTAVVPQVAFAEEGKSRASADLRASIDRAAVTLATSSPQPSALAASAMQSVGGGGGGKGKIIWAVVGGLTSAATTYFVVKEMRKQTENLTAQQ